MISWQAKSAISNARTDRRHSRPTTSPSSRARRRSSGWSSAGPSPGSTCG